MDASFSYDPAALPPLRGWRRWAWLVNFGLGIKPVPGLIEAQAETTFRERLQVMQMASKGYVPDDLRLLRFAEVMGRHAEYVKGRRASSVLLARRLDAWEVAGDAAAQRIGRHPGGAAGVTVSRSDELLGIVLAVLVFTVSLTLSMAVLTRTESGTVVGLVVGLAAVPACRVMFQSVKPPPQTPGLGVR